MNKIIGLILIISVTISCSKDHHVDTRKEEFLNELKQEIQREKIPGCGIVVLKNDEIIISESIGLADVAFSLPVDSNTIFSINSIAEIFASTAIMKIVKNKKMNLSNPISNYLDNLPVK